MSYRYIKGEDFHLRKNRGPGLMPEQRLCEEPTCGRFTYKSDCNCGHFHCDEHPHTSECENQRKVNR